MKKKKILKGDYKWIMEYDWNKYWRKIEEKGKKLKERKF